MSLREEGSKDLARSDGDARRMNENLLSQAGFGSGFMGLVDFDEQT